MKWSKEQEENLEAWESIAPMHAQGSGAKFYRIEEFLAGECKLGPWEVEEMGPVEDKTLLHLQCHIGTDTLSWARRGAKVTGLDFSPKAVAEAERFAGLLGIADARFVTATVEDAVAALDGEQFDILYTGRGALCWLPDLDRWAEICSQLVKPGGTLYLEEVHPVVNLLDEIEVDGKKVLTPKYSPFATEAVSWTDEGSYADRAAKTGVLTSHCWEFRFDSLLGALRSHGFRLELLHERAEACCMPWSEEFFEPSRPNYWRMADGQVPIPMTFTLRARRER